MKLIFSSLIIIGGLIFGMAGCATGDAGARGNRADGGAGTTGESGSGGGKSGSGGSSAKGGSGGEDWLDEICFMHDCESDDECVGCPNGRVVCDESSKRCVKCVPGEPPDACDDGEVCSQYGTCIPEGMTCPTDATGEPTVTCTTDNDCFACDTMHQVCDTASGKCVACSDTNLFACDSQASCKQGKCMDKCPYPCTMDEDCASCGTMVNTGHACNETSRHCSECSASHPCPAGSGTVCGPQGMCIKVCGALDKPKGTCQSDDDCKGCEGDLIACHKPINGGDGRCGVPASGCSDIPGNFAVLPEPWSQVTNLCSKDGDCSGVSLDLNVGKILRDLTGLDQIKDAVLPYGMNVCAAASVSVMGKDYACGVCVPCRKDDDCKPIKFDPLIEQAFGPVGSLVAKVLIKMAFGDAPHELNMYCEPVLGEYGVCAPCIDFLHECGNTNTVGSGCHSDWECAAGERCKDGRCQVYKRKDCFGADDCPNGQVCSWNGEGYCCRDIFQGTKTCFSDAECVPQVCAWNGTAFYCTDPVACE
ncbi:MAG TPA: hypothetical protein PLJ27_04295 [Polyangiaceae bacterium]|nr:MAG: hypothetical protein BWY17_02268 [Deltaproteobacteria bacterium ADurb.Bin207]HNS99792.1 hypothetical protein [Polyangiaceae bacterium]HNZ23937.1 hypothetical protein [Polyangiaceae bacterium]HOD25615.1 hypothetical protein [Polyangiaceae bacterium]HOE51924.1 hypothetical protein [Polyangiaceae bacterium]